MCQKWEAEPLSGRGSLVAMRQRLSLVTVLVRDYDEALDFYVGRLGFNVVEDKVLSPNRRWVTVAPGGGGGGLLLARADGAHQSEAVGRQAAGRVFLFLETDDFRRDHARLSAAGVHFREEPREEDYGTVAVFEDLYGNLWDLIEHRLA